MKKLDNNIAIATQFRGTLLTKSEMRKLPKKLNFFSNASTYIIADCCNISAIQKEELNAYLAYPQQYVSYYLSIHVSPNYTKYYTFIK